MVPLLFSSSTSGSSIIWMWIFLLRSLWLFTFILNHLAVDSISSMEMGSVHAKVPPSPLRVPPSPSRFSMSPKLDRVGSVHLNMHQVVIATQNFSESLKIGEGGFGTVYKANLPDGVVVAIKRAKKVII